MRSEKGYEKSPEAHYDTMSFDALAALPVDQLAGPDAFLVMWATWPHLQTALDLMEAWRFAYKTGGPWVKRTPSGKVAFGTGYIFRNAADPFIVGTIGSPEIGSKSLRNLIEGVRREHSRKPPQMRELCEKLAPRAWRCELFAREPWAGADVWGNETTKFAEAT